MEFKKITTFKQLLEIETDYEDLLSRINDYEVFYEFAWLKNYIMYFPDSNKKLMKSLCIIVGYIDNKIVLLCPFCLRNKNLEFICSGGTDYNSILVDSNVNQYLTIRELVKYINENVNFRKIFLLPMRENDILNKLYTVLNTSEYFISFLNHADVAPYFDFRFDTGKFVKKQIADIRRRERKLFAEHMIEYEESEDLREEDIDFISKTKDERFGNKKTFREETKTFYLNLCKDFNSKIFITRCLIDGKLEALHFGFKDSKKLYYYIPVFNNAYKEYGLGKILFLHLVERDNNCYNQFDTLRGSESYKFDFCDRIINIFALTIFKKNLFNKIRFFVWKNVRRILQH